MFTGIVTEIGTVREARDEGDLRLTVETAQDLSSVDLGASIACSGVCLTVVGKGDHWFSVDVSSATRDGRGGRDADDLIAVTLEAAAALTALVGQP